MALIKCCSCNKEINDSDRFCSGCGAAVPDSSTVKVNISYPSAETKTLYDNYKTDNSKSPDSGAFIVRLIVGTIVALVFYYASSSWFVGLLTFVTFMYAFFRADFLVKNQNKKSTFDKVLFSWKGIVGYIVLMALIAVPQNLYSKHVENKEKEKSQQTRLDESKKIYEQKKIEFKAVKTIIKNNKLQDIDLDKAKTSLASIDASMPEYKEAQELLPSVIKRMADIDKATRLKEAKERKAADDAQYTSGGKRIHAKHPNWSPDDCNTIAKGQIRLGMTTKQVAAAWGRPYDINRTQGSYGLHEQWVMHEMGSSYVYFEDGICTTIQN